MMKRLIFLSALMLAAAAPLKAQFFKNGEDPGQLRWFSVETPHYEIIFPQGTDSLARVYGRQLEQFRVPIGRSYGTTPGEGQRRKMPVVLHTHNPYSNGSVGWAPRRMDLYTQPDPGGADPMPWSIQLTSHEPRHQAQLQQGRSFLNVLTGEIWNPVYWQIFLGWALGEGDAVVAETGLTAGGRARTADFLNYYQVALDQGDYRNGFRWRYGSYKHYTPDYYTLGYLTVAGARYLSGNPLIVQETVDGARKRPWLLSSAFRSRVKENLGGKRFNDAFREILDSVNVHWQAEAAARGPFQEMEQVTFAPDSPIDYGTPQVDDDGTVYARRDGHLHPGELVAIRDGKVSHVEYVHRTDVSIFYEPVKNRLYWTEIRKDPRWKQSGTSVVLYYDINSGKTRTLAAGHRYYNAQPNDDGTLLATAEYLPNGETHVVLLSTEDGRALRHFRAPDGIQASEFGWYGEYLYLSGVSAGGYGIYCISPDGSWKEVLAPSVQKVVNMGNGDGYLEWISDRTGVNEYYRYYPEDGRLLQMSNTRYGITDPFDDGTYLYSVSQTLQGVMVFRTPLEALQPREVQYSDVHRYFLADALTAQEQSLGPAPDLESAVPISAPKRYYKWQHPLRLHSWLPFYVNYDAVLDGSMDFSYKTASLGLSGFFQNTLGTFSGMVGYGLHRSPDNRANWRNALHAKFVYSGLYPVLEASVDLGDRRARQYYINQKNSSNGYSLSTAGFLREAPLAEASFRAYVPLTFQRFGVATYGLIPQIRYTVSNNLFATDPVRWEPNRSFEGLPARLHLADVGTDANVAMQRLSLSVRGYAMLATAEKAVYPRLGIGAELGAHFRPGLEKTFTPNVYAYLYGYLPGIWRSQGLKLTALVQRQIRPEALTFGELGANTLPRGFDDEVGPILARESPLQWKVTADYAIPIYVGDINIPGFAYITHFVLTPNGDYTGLSGGGNLWSIGADLTAEMPKLILPYDTSLGGSFSYLGGSWYKNTDQEKPWSVELIFDVDF